MGDRVDDLARKLYWRERRRALRGAQQAGPVYPEGLEGPDENEPLKKTAGTPAEVLERISASSPESAEGVGWTRKDAELPEPAGDTQEGWPCFEKLSVFTGEDEPLEGERAANTASIWRFARKMMAREWRRALNKAMPDAGMIALEDEAARIKEELGERKSREALKEEAKQRADRQVSMLADALADIADFYARTGNDPDPEEFLGRVTGAVRDLGFVFDIRWDTGGCEIWMEPWEERRLRRMRRDDDPVAYHIGINGDMEVVLWGIGWPNVPLRT